MNNPYATNRGGRIEAPKNEKKGEPRVTKEVAVGNRDLRSRSK